MHTAQRTGIVTHSDCANSSFTTKLLPAVAVATDHKGWRVRRRPLVAFRGCDPINHQPNLVGPTSGRRPLEQTLRQTCLAHKESEGDRRLPEFLAQKRRRTQAEPHGVPGIPRQTLLQVERR